MNFAHFINKLFKKYLLFCVFISRVLSWSEEKHCKKMEPYYILKDDLPAGVICPSNNTVMITEAQSKELSEKHVYELYDLLVKQCYIGDDTASHDSTALSDQLYCPRTFDGFACWGDTLASTTVHQNCPSYVIGFDDRRLAHKTCTDDGTWLTHPETGKPWTNYTDCVDLEDLAFRKFVNNIYLVNYIASSIALIISLFIFWYFRKLKCTRVRVHTHLFTAMLCNNISWIIWYLLVIDNTSVVQNNEVWCQVLHIITYFFMVSNYVWTFCESLYLYTVVVIVFVQPDVIMRYLTAIGWGVSFILTVLYAILRIYVFQQTDRCWLDNSDALWAISGPIFFAILVSIALTISIIRELLKKIPPVNRSRSAAAFKTMRAALILIPLFGINFVFFLYRPQSKTPLEKAYQIVSAMTTSLQGLVVSIMFCFMNNEVIATVKAHFAREFRLRNEMLALTGGPIGNSAEHTRDREIRESVV